MKKILICLFTLICLIPNLTDAAQQSPGTGYLIDNVNHKITIFRQGNETDSINSALQYLVNRPDKENKWTLYLSGGEYLINKKLLADKLENTVISSLPGSNAVLKKSPDDSGEYLLLIRFSKNIVLKNIKFIGKTKIFDMLKPNWGEQGVYFGSSKNIIVSNCSFNDFGDAALRITTSSFDSGQGINCSDIQILNNRFENSLQISTTSERGGVYNYLFKDNKLINMHGALKFAARLPGASKVRIVNNSITDSGSSAIEIVGYSDVTVADNIFKNIKDYMINLYTNHRALKGFQWGDNITVKNNQVFNAGRGIRFSPNPYHDGYIPTPENFVMSGNLFDGINEATVPVISIVNGSINGISITNNRIKNYSGKKWINIDKKCKKVSLNNNVLN